MGKKKSILSYLKKKTKEDQKDLQNRAKQFMEEYKVIRARYCCDFQAYLQFKDKGEGGIAPSIRIIDVTKTIEAEEEAERKRDEAIKKQREQQANQEKKDGN